MLPHPRFHYDLSSLDSLARVAVRAGEARLMEVAGRRGLNLPAIRSRCALPEHTANEERGAVAIWVLSQNDLFPSAPQPGHKISNAYYQLFNLISDSEAYREFDSACFLLSYSTDWHPVFVGKFFRGNVQSGYYDPAGPHAMATSNYFFFRRLRWMQIVFTWDKPAGLYRIYANGVLVGVEDYGQAGLKAHPVGPLLYLGNPNWIYHAVSFFDQTLSAEQVRGLFARDESNPDQTLAQELKEIYEGRERGRLTWQPPADWREALALEFKSPRDLALLMPQGRPESVGLAEDGLELRTEPHGPAFMRANPGILTETHKGMENDFRQLYVWLPAITQGDLYVSYEFCIKAHGGLSLLMAQASGMQGEDFVQDYFPRSTGNMRMVCWEDVRNYHWEYYREMCDTRHDLTTHALVKNPWFRGLDFQCVPRRWELDRWHKLEFLQLGARITGAIDGNIAVTAEDDPTNNNGPVLRGGRLAIRCMLNTHIRIRNLRVLHQSDVREVRQ